ncbi:MAG TPA: hypothetical protein VGW12_07690 [Pyrinomonadaceae bacterium]|nr:hypothetical protein [Pyrinomonadaceae bacterium]
MPTELIPLADLVHVGARFGRSVNLERDFYEQVPLNGYILTTTGRSALHRLGQSLTDTAGERSWTLTGPYGSGKSAFALFAAKTLSTDHSDDTQTARLLIKDQDRELWGNLFDRRRNTALRRGLCPVLVSGTREPITVALLRGLVRSIEQFWQKSPPLVFAEVKSLLSEAEAGNSVPGRRVADVFEEVAQKVCSSRANGDGLLIVVDELGKLLEYAATNPKDGDIFVLQELAEAAKRSGESPILLVTILHQAFDRYVERLGRAQREEWMKVQGRFEDLAFQEPTEQILRILAQAVINDGPHPAHRELIKYGHQLAQKAEKLGLMPRTSKREHVVELLEACVPLHPTVSVALGHVFRRLGQNERSFFAFLSSLESHGFQEFLSSMLWDKQRPPTLRLDHLYDYIITALGSGLYTQGNAKRWAEVEAALNRLVDSPAMDIRLIKVIGLLRVIGDVGNLKPSVEVLQFALSDSEISADDVNAALERLQKSSIIVYRRHSDSFGLWEGSDIDIDEKVAEARAKIDPSEPLTHSLTKYFKPRPLVARRHSHRTGTLRYFDVKYVDLHGLDKALSEPLNEADGLILYAVALNAEEVEAFNERAKSPKIKERSQVLLAIPHYAAGLREAVFEVASLRIVRDNTPELEGDRAARKELYARLAHAEKAVEQLLRSSFDSSAGGFLTSDNNGCFWYYKGARIEVPTERALQEFLSRVCDKVFCKTFILRNELINRRLISSSAAAARRNLIEAMLAHAHKENLGLVGHPPQLSIYYSFLKETSIHRIEGERWGFFPPAHAINSGAAAVWQEMDNFFTSAETERRSVADLFGMLMQPPFGMKAAPLPILLCAALLYYDTEIALYENGSFVPSLSDAIFERLVKTPERFQVQRCRIAGVRAVVFDRLAKSILQKPDSFFDGALNLLGIVRPLIKFAANLPPYTRGTQRLPDATMRVRAALFEAREPSTLLFVQLPEACGVAPYVSDDKRNPAEIDTFIRTLRISLAKLQRAYDDLLADVERMIVAAFSIKGTGPEARSELKERALPLLDITVELKLKSFIFRLTDDELDHVGWLESIATLLANKPPAAWNDPDLARFEVNLAEVTRSFLNIELLLFELHRQGADSPRMGREIMRLGITTFNEPERQKVIVVNAEERLLIDRAGHAVEQTLASAGINGNADLRLAVLATLSQKLLVQAECDEGQRAKLA